MCIQYSSDVIVIAVLPSLFQMFYYEHATLTERVEGFEEAIRACENPMMQTDYDIQPPPHTSEHCAQLHVPNQIRTSVLLALRPPCTQKLCHTLNTLVRDIPLVCLRLTPYHTCFRDNLNPFILAIHSLYLCNHKWSSVVKGIVDIEG